jgi:hypothetical protein
LRQSISGVVTPRPAPARALVIGGKTPRGLLPSGDNPFKHCGGRFALTGFNGAVCPRWARLRAAPGTLSAPLGRALPLASLLARAPLRSAPGGLYKRPLPRFGAHLGRGRWRCFRTGENARRSRLAARTPSRGPARWNTTLAPDLDHFCGVLRAALVGAVLACRWCGFRAAAGGGVEGKSSRRTKAEKGGIATGKRYRWAV